MKNKLYAFVLAAIGATSLQSAALAEDGVEFLLFAGADDLERFSLSDPALQSSDLTPTLDFLLSYETGRWRILGEYFLTDDEHELERLQVGYNYSSDNTIWFGRFHQPLSVWKHRFHHGAYLQPSISKPSIENWEDDYGVIPSHVAGVLIEHWQTLAQDSGIRYSAAVGIAPTLELNELRPFDILDPDDSSGRIASSFNIAYYPDYVGATNFGLLGGYAEMKGTPNLGAGITIPYEVRQSVLGAQSNWEDGDWQILFAAYYADNKSRQLDALTGGWFLASYAQVLRSVSTSVDAYVRFEHTRNAKRAAYLKLFPFYIFERELVGIRWDFAEQQALAIEFSNNESGSDTFSEVRVQWSAVFR